MDFVEHNASECIETLLASYQLAAETNNGNKFYNKIGNGALAFYHSVYRALDKDQLKTEGFIDERYLKFLSKTNGCSLFDKSFYIFGASVSNKRSIALEEQAAISYEKQNCNNIGLAPSPFGLNDKKVGVLELVDIFNVVCDINGCCNLRLGKDNIKSYDSFDRMFCKVTSILIASLPFARTPTQVELEVAQRNLID